MSGLACGFRYKEKRNRKKGRKTVKMETHYGKIDYFVKLKTVWSPPILLRSIVEIPFDLFPFYCRSYSLKKM